MLKLNNAEINEVSGGASSECINAYTAMHENVGVGDLVLLLIFPLGFMKMWGEISMVQNICGGTQAYNEARNVYCSTHRCEKQ